MTKETEAEIVKRLKVLLCGALLLAAFIAVAPFYYARSAQKTTVACINTTIEWKEIAEKWEETSKKFEGIAQRNEESAIRALGIAEGWKAEYMKIAGRRS